MTFTLSEVVSVPIEVVLRFAATSRPLTELYVDSAPVRRSCHHCSIFQSNIAPQLALDSVNCSIEPSRSPLPLFPQYSIKVSTCKGQSPAPMTPMGLS